MAATSEEEVLAEITSRCTGWYFSRRVPRRVPRTIYHFTNASGLAGILGDRKIRASLITSLNDSSEVRYGVELALETLQRRRVRGASPLLDAMIRELETPSRQTAFRFEMVPFVVSFCGRVDNSIHCLHYGDSGRGTAIEFVSAQFNRPPFSRLVRVEYSRKRQEATINNLVQEVEEASAGASIPGIRTDLINEAAAAVFCLYLRLLAAEFKDKCFRDEQEWRLLKHEALCEQGIVESERPGDRTKFRACNGRVIPYRDIELLPMHLSAVTSIILGHSSPLDEGDLGLQILVRSANPKAKIERSKIPVR
jgi:hypothetical protein